ncbi:MAG TPA: hypothetical protein IAB07_01175 [Candidatus Caccalectryoclostridium excrementigallinarum]|uniref:Uncharacterized protein n=1 Tax=Candidatus Caccalectryoclostridium excrementigallinarum TaxID=2840710 RepID=A0A9D1MLN0_9FIRM|nr:hypothetical protein [Candidatus Caccalectryoclostridium excrementigallinarum]
MKKKIGITLAVIALLVCIISVVCLAGCKEEVPVETAQATTETNWAKINNKTATTSIQIQNAELSLGDGAMSITASAQIDLVRTWKDGVLTIDITAKPTDIDYDFGSLESVVDGLIGSYVNFDKLTGLEFKGQAYYNYGSKDKTIGVRNMSVTGLKSAIPALTDKNITDEAWEIAFMIDGQRVTDVSYNLSELNGLLEGGDIGDYIGMIFDENYTLDLNAIIDDLLLNQTLLDFSDSSKATLAEGSYKNSVSALDNLNFLMNVWNNISEAGNDLVSGLLSDEEAMNNLIPLDDSGENYVALGTILKALIPDFSDAIPSLIENITEDKQMNVSGTIADGIFTKLNMQTNDFRIVLDKDQVKAITDEVSRVLEVLGVELPIGSIIDAVAGGEAYLSLGNVVVNSTFTVA